MEIGNLQRVYTIEPILDPIRIAAEGVTEAEREPDIEVVEAAQAKQ
jgi:hypothetical protein